MSLEQVSVELDHAQSRLKTGLLTMLAQGSWPGVGGKRAAGWDLANSSADVYVDPVTYTLMLRPSSLRSAFYTSNAGDYAKLALSDFSGLTSTSWEENDKTGVGGSRFLRAQGVFETGTTISTWPANTAFCVSWFPHSEGSEFEALRFGWSDSSAYTSGVALRVWSTGRVQVYKDGLLVGEYSVGGGTSDRKDPNRWTSLTCIPCRKRELLVLSDTGEGFSHLFADLDEQLDEPVVLPATKFWFLVPAPAVADIQIHRVRFPTSGAAYSVAGAFAQPPEASQGDPVFRVYGHRSSSVTPSLVTPTLGAFVANGSDAEARVNVALSGSGTTTPSVYGVLAQYEGELWETPGPGYDVTGWVTSLNVSVGESPDSTECEVVLGRIDELESETGLGRVRTMHGRPVRILLGGVTVFDGQVEDIQAELGLEPELDLVRFRVRDPWGPLDRLLYRDPIPLDGVPLLNAVRTLATAAGFPTASFDMEDPSFDIPEDGSPTSGEWASLVEVGDRPGDWARRLFEGYAGDWFFRFVPTAEGVKFVALPPESLPSSPAVTLWPTIEDAIGELVTEGFDAETARIQGHARVYQTYREAVVPCEATEVRVTGIEPRTGQPAYQSYQVDEVAEDATLDQGARPDNWRGEKLVYGIADPLFTSQAAVDRALEFLFARLSARRVLAEWTGAFVVKPDGAPLWPGDLVRLEGGDAPHLPGTFRVTSFSASFIKEPDPLSADGLAAWAWRPATYTGELVETSAQPWRGVSRRPGLDAATASGRAAALDRARFRSLRGAVEVLKRAPQVRTRA